MEVRAERSNPELQAKAEQELATACGFETSEPVPSDIILPKLPPVVPLTGDQILKYLRLGDILIQASTVAKLVIWVTEAQTSNRIAQCKKARVFNLHFNRSTN